MTPHPESPRGTGRSPRWMLVVLAGALAAGRPSPGGFTDIEDVTARLVGAHRSARHLAPLQYDAGVAAIARAHSADMAAGRQPLGHGGFTARTEAVDRHLAYEAVAENVAMNDYPAERTAAVAVDGWLASARHRENIEGDFDVTGVGVARASGGMFYFTQIFVKRRR